MPASTSSSGAGSLALLNSASEFDELNGESSIEHGSSNEYDTKFGSSEPPPEKGTYHGILHPEPHKRDQQCPELHEREFQTAIPDRQEPQQPNGTYLNGDILNHEIFAQRKHFSKAAIDYYNAWRSFEHGEAYKADIWPQTWDTKRTKDADTYYESMPE